MVSSIFRTMFVTLMVSGTAILLISCAAGPSGGGPERGTTLADPPLKVIGYTQDATYGYTQQNPIKVGGGIRNGAANQVRYLQSLRGPKGEKIRFVREGSCCPFSTPNGLMDNMGMLDIYKISYEGLKGPLTLYINLYDFEMLAVPVGLTAAVEYEKK